MPPNINDLLEKAKATAEVDRPHRNDQYIPVVKTLVLDKKMTSAEVKTWFGEQGITLGSGWCSSTRRKILEQDDLEQDAGATMELGPPLQPVATPPPVRTRVPLTPTVVT